MLKNIKKLQQACQSTLNVLLGKIGLTWSYYDGRILQSVNAQIQSSRLLVLARHLYSETIVEFPPSTDVELKKIIELRYGGQTDIFYSFSKQSTSSLSTPRFVTIWQLTTNLPVQCLIWIPISWLYSELNPEGVHRYTINENQQLIVSKHPKGISSAVLGRVLTDPRQFLLSVGLPVSNEVTEHSEGVLTTIDTALKKLTKAKLKIFLPNINANQFYEKSVQYIPNIALVLVVFFAFTWGVLKANEFYIDTKMQSLREQSVELLSLQDDIENATALLDDAHQFVIRNSNNVNLWKALHAIAPVASLEKLSNRGDRVYLEGRTTQSTQVMSTLVNLDVVDDPKFELPVRKIMAYEAISISFLPKKTGGLNE